MATLMKASMAFALAACVDGSTTSSDLGEGIASLTIYASNQSFEIDPVDIVIEINGEQMVAETLAVGDQHQWTRRTLALPVGQHVIYARSPTAGIGMWAYVDLEVDLFVTLSFDYSQTHGVSMFGYRVSETEPGFL